MSTASLLLAAITLQIINAAPGISLQALQSSTQTCSVYLASAQSLHSVIVGDPVLHIDVKLPWKWHLKMTFGCKQAISNTF